MRANHTVCRWVVLGALALAGCSRAPAAHPRGTGATGSGSGGSGAAGTSTGGLGGSSGANSVGIVISDGSVASGTGAGTQCAPAGSTRSCCNTGTEICVGGGEFPKWGPCLDSKGTTIASCDLTTPSGCALGEFGPHCDGGIDAGHKCGVGEFGPGCDGGTRDAAVPPGDGGLPPGCVPVIPGVNALCNDPNNPKCHFVVGYNGNGTFSDGGAWCEA